MATNTRRGPLGGPDEEPVFDEESTSASDRAPVEVPVAEMADGLQYNPDNAPVGRNEPTLDRVADGEQVARELRAALMRIRPRNRTNQAIQMWLATRWTGRPHAKLEGEPPGVQRLVKALNDLDAWIGEEK